MKSLWLQLACSLVLCSWIPSAFATDSEPPSCKLLFGRMELIPQNQQHNPMERLQKLSLSPEALKLELMEDLPHAAGLIKAKFHSSMMTVISHNQETSDQAFYHLLESALLKSEAFYQFQLVVVPDSFEAARIQQAFPLFLKKGKAPTIIKLHPFDLSEGYTAFQEKLILESRSALRNGFQNIIVATYEEIDQLSKHNFAENIAPKFENVFVLKAENLALTKSSTKTQKKTLETLSRVEENIHRSTGQIFHFETVFDSKLTSREGKSPSALTNYQYWTFVDDYSRFSYQMLQNQVPMVDFVTASIQNNALREMELNFIKVALATRRFEVLYKDMKPDEKSEVARFLAAQLRVYGKMSEFKQILSLTDEQLMSLYKTYFKN